jgi:uncharacterized protein YndB with AHSA1/START domain
MTSEQLSVTTTIPVTPGEVFAVLADPTSHAAINGSVGGTSSVRTGWVNGAIDTEPITKAGQVFRMGMFHPDHPDGDYVTANQVREFEPPRVISWATGTEDDDGRLSFGGWFWRYDLTPAGPSSTTVTLTYDWSAASVSVRELIGFPPFPPEHLGNSLAHLAELVTV